MSQILCFGEALIDVFAEKGVPWRAAETLHPSPGGAPANVAVALARLGAEVGFIILFSIMGRMPCFESQNCLNPY